jgi:hypothetical protein
VPDARSGVEGPEDFGVVGEPADALLGEDQLAVPVHLEDAATPFDELDLDIVVTFAQ